MWCVTYVKDEQYGKRSSEFVAWFDFRQSAFRMSSEARDGKGCEDLKVYHNLLPKQPDSRWWCKSAWSFIERFKNWQNYSCLDVYLNQPKACVTVKLKETVSCQSTFRKKININLFSSSKVILICNIGKAYSAL